MFVSKFSVSPCGVFCPKFSFFSQILPESIKQNDNDKSHIYIERLFPDKKELRSTSFYNRPMQTTKEKLLKILGVNKKTDLSKSMVFEKDEINKAGAGGSGSNPD